MSVDFIYGTEFRRRVRSIFVSANERAYIFSAFCRSEVFSEIFCEAEHIVPSQRLVMRWRPEDLLNGVSDINSYYRAKDYGWEVFINFDLHAKTFVFDDRCFVGSANLTEAGCPTRTQGNIELGIESTVNDALHSWIEQVFDESVPLSEQVVEHIAADIEANKENYQGSQPSFSGDTLSMLYRATPKMEIFTSDFPWTNDPETLMQRPNDPDMLRNIEHDLAIYGLSRPIDSKALRNAFLRSKVWRWFVSQLDEERYFGDLTQRLQESLADDPAPFRKDVKTLLQNIISWSEKIAPENIELDQPRYSQRIRRMF